MCSFPVLPRSEPLVERTYAALGALHEAFESDNEEAKALVKALRNDDILKCGIIKTGYDDGRCSTWEGFCGYYELTKDQKDRFVHLLSPLSGVVTAAIDPDGFHVILGDMGAPENGGRGWLMRIDYLMADDPFHRMLCFFSECIPELRFLFPLLPRLHNRRKLQP